MPLFMAIVNESEQNYHRKSKFSTVIEKARRKNGSLHIPAGLTRKRCRNDTPLLLLFLLLRSIFAFFLACLQATGFFCGRSGRLLQLLGRALCFMRWEREGLWCSIKRGTGHGQQYFTCLMGVWCMEMKGVDYTSILQICYERIRIRIFFYVPSVRA